MRILYSHYLLDDDNAPARIVHAISRELSAMGHEVLVHRSYGRSRSGPAWPLASVGPETASGGTVRWAKSKVWFAKAVGRNVPMYRNDIRAIKAFRPDVVLARQDAYCLSMALAARRSGVPLVTHADAPTAYENRKYGAAHRWHPPALLETFERGGLAPSRAVIATSHPTAEKLAEYRLRMDTRVVPNGIDPALFPELSEHERVQARREVGIDAPYVVGFQGTFRGFHGIDRLRDLMLATSGRGDVHWLLIGDGPLRGDLEAAVAGRVRATFLGRRPHEAMGRLLALVDVAVVPHEMRPGIFYFSPLKIIESAAAGCVVVAGHQGDIPWLLDHGRAGVLLKVPDVSVWADAIGRVLDDPGHRRSLGQAARRYVMANFTWRQIAKQYEGVLSGVVDGKREPTRLTVSPPARADRRWATNPRDPASARTLPASP